MSELYEQIVSQRGSLERLVARIPGFRGYLDRDARRTADRMLRDHIADLLAQRIRRMAELERTLLDQGGLAYMSKTRDAKTRIQLFHDRVKAAAPGYSGFFAAIKVDSAKMEELYSFDEAQIRYTDRFDAALDALAKAITDKAGIDEAIAAIHSLASEANEAFSLREDVLTDLDKSLSS